MLAHESIARTRNYRGLRTGVNVKIMGRRTFMAAAVMILAAFSAVACGEGEDAELGPNQPGGGQGLPGGGVPATQPATQPTPRPTTAPLPTGTPAPGGRPGGSPDDAPVDEEIANAQQQRIIVRTVDMTLVVGDIPNSVQAISTIATDLGGWVVATDLRTAFEGSITVRVPAQSLDQALRSIRSVAAEVQSEVSTSQDFTEEFTDVTARAETLRLTRDSLQALFDRAERIEDAIAVQQEISRVQADLESLQARLNFLQESSAFSRVTIQLRGQTQSMPVDGRGDVTAAVGGPVQFRAVFTPPQGIDQFEVSWDFGDGSGVRTINRSAPTLNPGEMISAPISHVYADDRESPYIATVKVRGTGPSGVAEGTDTIVVTVSRIPVIEVFAGENMIVDAGTEVDFRGTFTRPEGLENLTFEWNFGDGSAPFVMEVPPDATAAEAKHTYDNHRPQPYRAVLTVRGDSAAGPAEARGTVDVLVEEVPGLTTSEFTPGSTARAAVRTLTTLGQALANIGIFLAILSPVWLLLGAVIWIIVRNQKRSTPRSPAPAIRMSDGGDTTPQNQP